MSTELMGKSLEGAIATLIENDHPFAKQVEEFEFVESLQDVCHRFSLEEIRDKGLFFRSHCGRFVVVYYDNGKVIFRDTSDAPLTKMKKEIVINQWDKDKRKYQEFPGDFHKSVDSTIDKIELRMDKLNPATYRNGGRK